MDFVIRTAASGKLLTFDSISELADGESANMAKPAVALIQE